MVNVFVRAEATGGRRGGGVCPRPLAFQKHCFVPICHNMNVDCDIKLLLESLIIQIRLDVRILFKYKTLPVFCTRQSIVTFSICLHEEKYLYQQEP